MSGDDAWRPPEPAPPRDHGPELLPGYDAAVEVARGADSVVYRATQRALGRQVAVKVLQVDDPATVARFRRELDLTVRLGRLHPHVVTVLDTGVTSDGRPAIVMEYLERGSLHDVLRAQGPLPSADVVRIGKVVADALSFAHAQGVLHRDVKPQNILVLPTSWVLADFGIARLADSGSTASVEQFSYRHAAPQVLDGLPPTAADDVWSLGSTLFTLLDGRPPFASDDPDDDTALAYLRRVRTQSPRSLDRADLPAGLADVIARCLRHDPAERFPSAQALEQVLARVEGESSGWAPAADEAPSPSRAPVAHATPALTEPVVTSEDDGVETSSAAPEPGADPNRATGPGSAGAAGPVAVPAASALAHTRADDGPRDADPTGTVPSHRPDGDPTSTVGEGATSRRGMLASPGRRVALGLAAGAAIGVALVLLTGGGGGDPTAGPSRSGTPTSNTVPTASPDPSTSATPIPPVQVPELRPVVVDARGRGTSVSLEWTDPSEGAATFFVTQVGLPEPQIVASFPPGATSGVVEGVDPEADEVCYVVGALVGQDAATSAQRCLDPSP